MRVPLMTAALLATTTALPQVGVGPDTTSSAPDTGKINPYALPAVASGVGGAVLAGWALFERRQRAKVEQALQDHIKHVDTLLEEQQRFHGIDVTQARILGRTEGWFELESDMENYYCEVEEISKQLVRG